MDNLIAAQSFAALSNETRLDIFRFLIKSGPDGACAGDIAEACAMPSSTLSHHLNQMRESGLIIRSRQSRSLIYSVDFSAMNKLIVFLTSECCNSQPELCR
jgi:ArsR family transcriptional regulator